MELLSFENLTKQDEKSIEELMTLFTLIPLKNLIKIKAIQLRKQKRFKLADAINVASAIYLNCSFVSADKKLLDLDEVSGVTFDI